jgi:hypothetical protein
MLKILIVLLGVLSIAAINTYGQEPIPTCNKAFQSRNVRENDCSLESNNAVKYKIDGRDIFRKYPDESLWTLVRTCTYKPVSIKASPTGTTVIVTETKKFDEGFIVIVSNNSGTNWHKTHESIHKFKSIFFSTDWSFIYIMEYKNSEDKGVLIRSEDRGENWQVIHECYHHPYKMLMTHDGKRIYILELKNATTMTGYYEKGVLIESEDEGNNWRVIHECYHTPYKMLMTSDGSGIYVTEQKDDGTCELILSYSLNYGKSWKHCKLNDEQKTNKNLTKISEDDKYLVIADYESKKSSDCSIVYLKNLDGTWHTVTPEVDSKKIALNLIKTITLTFDSETNNDCIDIVYKDGKTDKQKTIDLT